MSYAYRQRKKAIKRYKRDNPGRLKWGQIQPVDFAYLQADWQRVEDGPLLGSLSDLMGIA